MSISKKKIYIWLLLITVFIIINTHKNSFQKKVKHKSQKKHKKNYTSIIHNHANNDNNNNINNNNLHVFIINLEHRKDRLSSITNLMKESNLNFTIINAINPRLEKYNYLVKGCYDNNICLGQVGCQYSHLLALNQSLKYLNKLNHHIAIFEDDFILQPFTDPVYLKNAIFQVMQYINDWSVIALSLNIISETILHEYKKVNLSSTFQASITQIHEAQTTTAYIIKKSIIPHIYSAFSNCNVKKDYQTAIDQCWKHLQKSKNFKWLAFEPQPGTQSKSFSDIERAIVDYRIA